MNPGGYRRTLRFNLGLSAYWFATSYKWFIILLVLLPDKVSTLVPDSQKNAAWGFVLGTGAIWAMVGPSVFGRLYETLSGRLANRGAWLAIGSGITVLAISALFGANSLWVLALSYFLLQIGDDAGTGPYAGMVADSVPPEHRGYASSILGALKLAGQIASALVALALGRVELIFVAIAIVNVLCATITILTIRKLPRAVPRPTQRRSFLIEYIHPFRSADFRAVWANRFVVAFAYGCVTAYALNFLKDMLTQYHLLGRDLGAPQMATNVLAITISLSGLFGAAYSARIADRTGRKPLLIMSAILMALALVPITMLRDYTGIWFCVIFFGFGLGVYQANDWAIASDVLPTPERAATEMGAWQSSETSVQVLVGLLMGPVIDAFNARSHGSGYIAMLVIAATLFTASVILVPRIRSAR